MSRSISKAQIAYWTFAKTQGVGYFVHSVQSAAFALILANAHEAALKV